ncbi:MAG TPA: class IV adenylate cyclase [Pyrinomonadaceae bacterium]|nr:class IV adenylate cyclase [Pyrinomonadaceae bacterium]
MSIEIEKKYRLSEDQRKALVRRLAEIGATREGKAFEENVLYDGPELKQRNCVLRLRRVGGRTLLTFKERLPGVSPIKQQREEETEVENADTMHAILEALGYRPRVVYEKKRETWRLGTVEIVLDELPFGLFLEIEGSAAEIEATEESLAIDLLAELATYPQLAAKEGKLRGNIIEARFADSEA